MDFLMIIFAAIGVVLAILLLNIIKGIIKILLYIVLFLLIASAGFSYLMIKDTKDLVTGLGNETSLFLLKDGGTVLTGFSIEKMNLSTARSIKRSEADSFTALYAKKDYMGIQGKNFKLFIFDKKAFPKTENFDPDSVLSYLEGKKKGIELANEIIPSYMPDANAAAFSLLVVYSFKEDPGYIVSEFRKGNVIIYPETFVFKATRFIFGVKR